VCIYSPKWQSSRWRSTPASCHAPDKTLGSTGHLSGDSNGRLLHVGNGRFACTGQMSGALPGALSGGPFSSVIAASCHRTCPVANPSLLSGGRTFSVPPQHAPDKCPVPSGILSGEPFFSAAVPTCTGQMSGGPLSYVRWPILLCNQQLAWFLLRGLNLCDFSCASKVFLEVLIIEPSCHNCPSHFCILLNYKTNTCKHISPIWSCWSSNTKIQTKMGRGPFSLQSPPFWCLMTTRPKQANNKRCKNLKLSTC